MAKIRLDVYLLNHNHFQSREKARASIMAGVVYVAGQKEEKPGTMIPEDAVVEVRENVMPFVSRGGLKLDKAVRTFGLSLQGVVAMDIGASTGGFTDCMLKNGAEKVFAVDVGYGQLAWELRTDPRVVCMERTNIRYVTEEQIGTLLDFASVDVSFISLTKVLPVAHTLLKENGRVVCLVKPQFEAGREKVGKHGVVREAATHIEVMEKVAAHCLKIGFALHAMDFSPVRGPEGNIEYLYLLEKSGSGLSDDRIHQLIQETVEASHNAF